MTSQRSNAGARRKQVAERCLIASDIDKTILQQSGPEERQSFVRDLAPILVRATSFGANLTLLTGNSMHQLCNRFLRWLIEHLCFTGHLELLERFHFFCNSGGVYARFTLDDERLSKLVREGCTIGDEVLRAITVQQKGLLSIHPRFINGEFIQRARIPSGDLVKLKNVMKAVSAEYFREIHGDSERLAQSYRLEFVSENGELSPPWVEARTVNYQHQGKPRSATVQITIKPVLSFRQAHHPEKLFGHDLRSQFIERLQRRIDKLGLDRYVARAGGRASIDVTQEKLDKAYGLEWLIDHLGLQGHQRLGQKFGSNAIYFGDEVIAGGGNDYPVTRIPGLLVLSVNSDQELIPFLSHVFVPSTILVGPEATASMLERFNDLAERILREDADLGRRKKRQGTALGMLKREIFTRRIVEKIHALDSMTDVSVEELQTLHAFVTLFCRKDPAARQWLAILVDQLDAIMAQLNTSPIAPQLALGASHPDNGEEPPSR